MIGRPSLLALTAGVAAVAVLANSVSLASPSAAAAPEAPQTRLGASIGQELSARDQEAARRNRALELREQAAKATEARIKAQLEAQQQPAAPAGTAVGAKAGETADQYEELARIYQAMKPAKAAVVFEQLDLDVQMRIAQRMRERSTAMILAAMTPKAAASLSMALARRLAVTAPASAPVSAQVRKSPKE